MMFMMPTPPTTSEISATHSSSVAIRPVVDVERVGHLGHVADLEVVGLVRRGCGAARAAAAVICSIAAGISVGRRGGATRIWSTLVNRTGCGVSAAWVGRRCRDRAAPCWPG